MPSQRAARLVICEMPAKARPTARPSPTPVASQLLAILDRSVAPPSPPPGDFGPCQLLRKEEAQSSGGADGVAGMSQARVGFERALRARKDCVNARSKKAVKEKTENEETKRNTHKKDTVLD
ncbi:unnamed protein product [Prorocentrum cordatum]|uniref:Uncharacterized protein n=1 Tax=Prorocentrum cordatum TaxID=2364126 RepID=A0ABN9TUU3_9DINO|nr:unnamed protein product [Polarella glacialis]